MFSRFLIVVFLFFYHTSYSEDLLQSRIVDYNGLKGNTSTSGLDSSSFLLNTKIISLDNRVKQTSHIINQRNIEEKAGFLFIVVFFLLFLFAVIRRSMNQSFLNGLQSFFSLRFKDELELKLLPSVFIVFTFTLIVSYTLLHFASYQNFADSNFLFLKLFAFVLGLLVFKITIIYFTVSMFFLKAKVKDVFGIIMEFMYNFVSISLPLVLVSLLISKDLLHSMFIIVACVFCFMYIVRSFKIVNSNLNLLTHNVFNSIIYFYTVEVIPIVLLTKYFKFFIV